VCKRIFPEGCVEGENKGYSRDYEAQWPPMRGRIRVRLFNADGKPTNPDITTRKQLFLKVAELIPRMPSRQAGYVDPQQVHRAAARPNPPARRHTDKRCGSGVSRNRARGCSFRRTSQSRSCSFSACSPTPSRCSCTDSLLLVPPGEDAILAWLGAGNPAPVVRRLSRLRTTRVAAPQLPRGARVCSESCAATHPSGYFFGWEAAAATSAAVVPCPMRLARHHGGRRSYQPKLTVFYARRPLLWGQQRPKSQAPSRRTRAGRTRRKRARKGDKRGPE